MFGFGKKKDRVAVATLMVGVDGEAFLSVQRRINEAAGRIVEADGDFDIAARETAAVAQALLDAEVHWESGALAGDVFDAEEDASAALGEIFADLAARYASSAGSAASAGRRDDGDGTTRERRCIAMITIAYRGTSADVERDLNDRLDVARVLRGIVTLREQHALLAAQVHVAPAHPDDRLTDEQLLANFPELLSL
jgi:hypothetical protein